MRKIAVLFVSLLCVALIMLLNFPIGEIPALGKLLNPTTGFWQNAEGKNFYLSKHIPLKNLKKKVEVYFDERKIPHIFAQNERDLYYTQGYVLASLRLWQMEFQVLAAEGRLSEILGNKTIEFDKGQRRLALHFGAKNKLKVIEKDKQSFELLQSYTDGVNAYLDQLKPKDYPLEYKLIGYKPEKWSNYKTVLVIMNMSQILASAGDDIENSNFLSKYGKELYEKIYPKYLQIDPIVPTPEKRWNQRQDTSQIIEKENPSTYTSMQKVDKKLDPVKESNPYHVGSNNWALSGAKTKSGYPLLCNDPHLEFSLPSVWIEMHLSCPESNTYGVTFPGSPGIIIGFNNHIGWGVTNSGRDVKDFYAVEYKDATKELYHYQNEWVKSDFVIEEIKVKGQKSVFDTVIYTHFGPVQFKDFETQAGKKDIAVQWMGHKGSNEFKMFYLLNKAKNFDDYLEATTYFDCPAQNIIFASIHGDIAIRNQGKFPIRNKKQTSFLQNSNEAKVWDEFIPFDDNPMQVNPKRNFVSSANQEPVDSSYPYYYDGGFENYRNRVVNKNLSQMNQATVKDMINLQANNFNLKASESLPLMLDYINTSSLSFNELEIYKLLDNWNFMNNKQSVEAMYYEEFYNKYFSLLWEELQVGFKTPSDAQTIYLLKDSVLHPFIDNSTTSLIEDQSTLLNIAFKHTTNLYDSLKNKNWGQYNNVQFEHLARIPSFSQKIEYGGNDHIVNATRKKYGASWRMILDFDQANVQGVGVYPGGQSGNPGSRQYDNMIAEWANGQYHKLENSKNKADYQSEKYQKIAFLPILNQ